jgi:hypothetical protein
LFTSCAAWGHETGIDLDALIGVSEWMADGRAGRTAVAASARSRSVMREITTPDQL